MRVLCCLLLGSSVLLSGCGESKEDAAVAAIENMGGEVGFEGKLLSKPVSVHLSGRRVTDTGLVHLKGLTSLQTLNLARMNMNDADAGLMTDAGLVHLKGLTSLRHLDLSGARMTDTGLVHLKGMTSLSSLNLSGTKVTDAGLIHLKSMTNLTNLILPRTKVTTAGVKDLQSALPKCRISK